MDNQEANPLKLGFESKISSADASLSDSIGVDVSYSKATSQPILTACSLPSSLGKMSTNMKQTKAFEELKEEMLNLRRGSQTMESKSSSSSHYSGGKDSATLKNQVFKEAGPHCGNIEEQELMLGGKNDVQGDVLNARTGAIADEEGPEVVRLPPSQRPHDKVCVASIPDQFLVAGEEDKLSFPKDHPLDKALISKDITQVSLPPFSNLYALPPNAPKVNFSGSEPCPSHNIFKTPTPLPCNGPHLSLHSPKLSWADQGDENNNNEVEGDNRLALLIGDKKELENAEIFSSPTVNVKDSKETNTTGNGRDQGNWADVVKQGAGGMKLCYFKPSPSDGKLKIKPPPSVVQKGVARWENTVVGFFLDKLPFSLVQNSAMKMWGSKGLIEVLCNGNGFFFFRFLDISSAKHVLDGGPWYFGGRPIFLQMWKVGLNLSKSGCRRVPIWVHFHNIPLEYWSEEGLSYIASVVGKPLHADHMTESLKRINFARVCIEIDVDDTLPECFDMELLDGSCVEIKVEYNWVPKKCSVCKEFGHIAKNCKKLKTTEWRPKDAPSHASSRPRTPENAGLGDHFMAYATGNKEEDWKEVKRNGKAVVVDVSPSDAPTGSKAQASCSLNNVFEILKEGADMEGGENSLAIVATNQVDPLDSSKPKGEGNLSPHTVMAARVDEASPLQVVNDARMKGSAIPNSECSSGPINNPLLERISMVDELDQKYKNNSKKRYKRRNGGKGGPGRKNSS